MSRVISGLLVASAVTFLALVGFLIGHVIGTAVRPHGDRWLDLYDVFDEEDQDAIG